MISSSELKLQPSASTAGTNASHRYQIERLLGAGGIGSVYVALDSVARRQVALKRLPAAASATSAALFEREYQVLASLHHPSIVRVFDYGRDDEGPYYTMELIDGTDLSSRAPFPWRVACGYLRDIASILGLLHARKLVHRDLSPRNLLLTSSGRLKLIDFGALASFGALRELIGTPPLIAPEGLRGGLVDQRYDLFGLGALGYWMITGVNAFPARGLGDLPRLWERDPAPASSLVRLREDGQLEPIPAALDELLNTLLRTDPSERPADTTELVDRLNAIADLAPELEAVEGYLDSKIFVGRERECERVAEALHGALSGCGRAVLVESESGVGRSSFLREVAINARLAGLLTLSIDANMHHAPYAAASELCLQAIGAGSEHVRGALARHAPVLGRLSEALHARLGGGSLGASSERPGEDHERIQFAFKDLMARLSAQRPLAVLIDDFHLLDEESQRLFVSLADAAANQRLLVVASAARDGAREPTAALHGFRNGALRLHLLPLTSSQTLLLIRSLFGSPPFVERLADRLHRASDGNPSHCLELAQHLVRSGAIRYQDGIWILPSELPLDELPANRVAGQLTRLSQLSPPARALARLMSAPHHGPQRLDQCSALAGQVGVDVELALGEMVREGVLRQAADGYRFAHPELQATLDGELATSMRRTVHRVLARSLLATSGDAHDQRLMAAIHFLRADAAEQAYPLILAAADNFRFFGRNLPLLRIMAPLFAEVDELLERHGGDDYARVEPLAVLAMAGYFIDRRYADRFGNVALRVTSKLLKLELIGPLSGVLGRKLGLGVTLLVASIALFLHRRRGPTPRNAIMRLFQICSVLAGFGAIYIDPERVRGLAKLIEPFAILGEDHAAGITHRFISCIACVVEDRLAHANAELRSLLSRLESDRPIRELGASDRENYVAATLFSLGVNESWREGEEVLRVADRLERFGPMYVMCADYLRWSYQNRQGNLERAEHYRQRVELHAIQLGTTWQVETWAAVNLMPRALRTFDAMLAKRGLQALARVAREAPSLAREERVARGIYALLRGKYAEAVLLLQEHDAPLAVVGWAGRRGALASAHNGLGEYAIARDICLSTLAQLTQEDQTYVVTNLGVAIELVKSEAGLRNTAAANVLLDGLFEQLSMFGDPVTLAQLYDARAYVALQARDLPSARQALAALDVQCRATGMPSLMQRLTRRMREVEQIERPNAPVVGSYYGVADDTEHVITRLRLVLSTRQDAGRAERAKTGLKVALELSGADEGLIIFAVESGAEVVHLGGTSPSPELLAWARLELEAANTDQETALITVTVEQRALAAETEDGLEFNYKMIDRMSYRAALLEAARPTGLTLVGVLVLGFYDRVPNMPKPEILSAIAVHLSV